MCKLFIQKCIECGRKILHEQNGTRNKHTYLDFDRRFIERLSSVENLNFHGQFLTLLQNNQIEISRFPNLTNTNVIIFYCLAEFAVEWDDPPTKQWAWPWWNERDAALPPAEGGREDKRCLKHTQPLRDAPSRPPSLFRLVLFHPRQSGAHLSRACRDSQIYRRRLIGLGGTSAAPRTWGYHSFRAASPHQDQHVPVHRQKGCVPLRTALW